MPGAPPQKNRKNAWKYDKTLDRQRNKIERYFVRLKHQSVHELRQTRCDRLLELFTSSKGRRRHQLE